MSAPVRISKSEALRRIDAQRRHLPHDVCTMCALLQGSLAGGPPLLETNHAIAMLARFPVRWGHSLIVLREHVTDFSGLDAAQWQDVSEAARRVAVAIERALAPSRCYVASLGAESSELFVTCPHLHLHVVPVYDARERPREVLTWEHGVFAGDDLAWVTLTQRLEAHLAE